MQQYSSCHFGMYFSGAKFEDHCPNISGDILNSEFYRFSGTIYEVITFLICIIQKRNTVQPITCLYGYQLAVLWKKNVPILYLHKSHNTPLLPPKNCIRNVLHFSWDISMSQEKLQTMIMPNCGVKEVNYGICASREW